MDFLINDLSIHGQFTSSDEFIRSVDVVMAIRQAIERAGRQLYCHRGLNGAQVTANIAMLRAVQEMPVNKRRAWMQWLTKVGPYWQDSRRHSNDDWLELDGEVICTDHAIAEAAYRRIHGDCQELVSFDPSDWLLNPVRVTWRKDDESKKDVGVPNHWAVHSVATSLEGLPEPFNSWESLEEHARRAFDQLTIAKGAFRPLEGYPYVKCVAKGIWQLLGVLARLNGGFDEDGNRTSEFEMLYKTYFMGEAPYFTDESDTNKQDYSSRLTFPHPRTPGATLFCSWHGKVNSPKNFLPIRIYFTWPAKPKTALYVVYVGPKITTR